jgi:translation initiation factor IF-2
MGIRWQVIVPWEDDSVSVGRAIVREIPASPNMEIVAECYVTQGVIARSALVRVIREGIRIYPLPDQTAKLVVLQEAVSAEDREEVREGFECTFRVKDCRLLRGDVVEAYRVEEV